MIGIVCTVQTAVTRTWHGSSTIILRHRANDCAYHITISPKQEPNSGPLTLK